MVQDKGSRMTQVGRGIRLTNQRAKDEGQASIQLIPVPPRMGKEAQSNACRNLWTCSVLPAGTQEPQKQEVEGSGRKNRSPQPA